MGFMRCDNIFDGCLITVNKWDEDPVIFRPRTACNKNFRIPAKRCNDGERFILPGYLIYPVETCISCYLDICNPYGFQKFPGFFILDEKSLDFSQLVPEP